jgi:hypothetical protein
MKIQFVRLKGVFNCLYSRQKAKNNFFSCISTLDNFFDDFKRNPEKFNFLQK